MSPKASSEYTDARPRVAVIGAGVCGLGIGWRLAQAGCPVTIWDRGAAGRGASWAAAGMLAAGVEAEPGEDALWGLDRSSQALWPDFAAELENYSGLSVDYRDEGTIVAALTHDEAEKLRFNYEYQRGLGVELEWLSGAEARRREPFLRAGIPAALWSPNDHQVDNRKLATALTAAFRKAGGTLREHAEVEAVETDGQRVTGLRVGGEVQKADIVVLAAGAWSRGIAGLPKEALPPVRPIKGQMISLRMDPAAPLLSHVLWTANVYLTPRNDGRLIAGATVEEKGFDTDLTAGGVYAVLEAAMRAIPAIEELPIDEMWVGFRPGSRDDAPILGPAPAEGPGALDGLVYATGHHRNGILLTPITADTVSRHILTGEIDPAIRPFGLDRFARKARRQVLEIA